MRHNVFDSVDSASVWYVYIPQVRRIRAVVRAVICAGFYKTSPWLYQKDENGMIGQVSYVETDCKAVEPTIDMCDWFQRLQTETD